MAAKNLRNWKTSIANVVSSVSEEEVIVRSRKLSNLIGSITFSEMMYLILGGELPTKAQARVLEASLVAPIEHGIAPSPR